MAKIERKHVGDSTAILEILEEIDRAAGSNARVLISGNPDAAKETIARRIHEQSARRSGPFVAMTCVGVRSDLLGSQFFGWVERADRGTLFIDEIGALDSRLQESVAAFLENGDDVRIIAASGRNLHQDVVAGRFNATLFYRLNVIHIVVPERRGESRDISRRFTELQPSVQP